MMIALRIIYFTIVLSTFSVRAGAEDFTKAVSPPYYRVHYEGSTNEGELKIGVTYTVWIPPGVKILRGVIVHQHGCGEGGCKDGVTAAYDLHWQALARKQECALLGPAYEQSQKDDCHWWCDPRNGSEKIFLQSLANLAKQSNHPELETVPWALWGHSGGGDWVGDMFITHPDRTIAVWVRSSAPPYEKEWKDMTGSEIPAAAYAVPVMCNLGAQEGLTVKTGRYAFIWGVVHSYFKEFRAKGGLIGVAVDPNSSHDCGNSRYLAIPWFDACLIARLPEKAGDANLKPMPVNSAWLAPLLGKKTQPAAKFTGDARTSVWLPNERIARAWVEYEKNGNVRDTTPPPAPTNMRVSRTGELSWDAEADLESGIAAFIIERDGVKIARVPKDNLGYFVGRPVFQRVNGGDTPATPLAEMRYTDSKARKGSKHSYTVRTINSVGLESKPCVAVATP
ncbi:MAG: GDSL-like Lipase/Acylhydrolase [Pedosphaera sp.]|nr:GDSL-like Lipase/Acylhydrolase [Pedosphaera sp.]